MVEDVEGEVVGNQVLSRVPHINGVEVEKLSANRVQNSSWKAGAPGNRIWVSFAQKDIAEETIDDLGRELLKFLESHPFLRDELGEDIVCHVDDGV